MRPLALFAAALGLAGCLVPPAPPSLTSSGTQSLVPRQPGTPAPQALELSLRTWPDHAPWRLSQTRGSVVLLDVWASWCEPCRDSLPLFQDFQKEFGARGLKVFALNVEADEREVEKFVKETKLTLPVLLDPEARVSEVELKVKMMPTTILIDRKGAIRHVEEGFAEEFVSKYLSLIETLLAEAP